MAKQTFTTGQVLTAAQMTSLQQTAMGGGAASTKTSSYVLVAADAGTTIQMNSASPTTITVNTALFAAGDVVFIQNIGAGACTITAGTATVTTAGSLVLSQWEGGQLYFTSTSASIFFDYIQSGGGGKVLQVVQATYSTQQTNASTTYADTGLSLSITPSATTSKILVLISQSLQTYRNSVSAGAALQIVRGSTAIFSPAVGNGSLILSVTGGSGLLTGGYTSLHYLDSPATISATTYKTQHKVNDTTNTGTSYAQADSNPSSIILLEIGA